MCLLQLSSLAFLPFIDFYLWKTPYANIHSSDRQIQIVKLTLFQFVVFKLQHKFL